MDTRKLGTKHVGEEIAIKDMDSDNHDVVGSIQLTGDEVFDANDRAPLADELVKRFNAHPELIVLLKGFLQETSGKKLNIRKDFSLINYRACASKLLNQLGE